jgi:hypothetical protein
MPAPSANVARPLLTGIEETGAGLSVRKKPSDLATQRDLAASQLGKQSGGSPGDLAGLPPRDIASRADFGGIPYAESLLWASVQRILLVKNRD